MFVFKKYRSASTTMRATIFLGILSIIFLFQINPVFAQFNTTIIVDTTTDPTPDRRNSCNFNGSLGLSPAQDGLCSLRRAFIEASDRPPEDRPILIAFNLPAAEQNQVVGTWTIVIDPSVSNRLPPIETISNVTQPDSLVTIDGATQPNGRSSGGPAVFIDTPHAIEFERTGNTLKNVGIYGGATVRLKRVPSGTRDVANTVDNIWMGLSENGQMIVLENPADPDNLAGGGIVVSNSDNNVISNNVVSGAQRAIDINDGNNNIISDNIIGTMGDGTITKPIDCSPTFNFDSNLWYGGGGIRMTGDDNQIIRNRIAGLNNLRAPLDTPPMAIDFTVTNNLLVEDNIIGVDAAGAEVGTCGGAIDGSGPTQGGRINRILGNTVVMSSQGFPGTALSDTVIFISGGTGFTMRENIIKDATTNAITFTITAPDAWKNFEPAVLTSINGTTVTGTSAAGSPCPNCIIDLYRDNYNNKQEAFEFLGSAQADANGNFTVNLPAPLPSSCGIRTISTTTQNNVIPGLAAGTSTKMSGMQIAFFKDAYDICPDQI